MESRFNRDIKVESEISEYLDKVNKQKLLLYIEKHNLTNEDLLRI